MRDMGATVAILKAATFRSWDKGVLTDLCLTGVLTDLCLTLYFSYIFPCHIHYQQGEICARYLKPDIVLKLLIMVSIVVMS